MYRKTETEREREEREKQTTEQEVCKTGGRSAVDIHRCDSGSTCTVLKLQK